MRRLFIACGVFFVCLLLNLGGGSLGGIVPLNFVPHVVVAVGVGIVGYALTHGTPSKVVVGTERCVSRGNGGLDACEEAV